MAWAGSLFFRLIPEMDSKALAKAATEAGNGVGQSMGTAAGKATSEHIANGITAGSSAAEAKAAALGAKVGTAIGKPLGMALSPLGPAIDGALNMFDRLPVGAQKAISQIPTYAASAGRGMVSAFSTATEQAHQTFGNWSNRVKTTLSAPFVALDSLTRSFGVSGAASLGILAGEAVKTGVQFDALKERATIAFGTMLGSGEKADKMMRDLTDFALRTPFELPGMIESTQQLIAFGFKAEDVIPTLTAVGDAVSGLGGNTVTLQRITYALGQIMTRGKVMSTEMLQLTNAGIPAWAILANGMGKSTGEMQKMVEKGLVPASTAIPILLKGIEQGTDGVAGKTVAFAGMMEQQYNTLSGIWARTKEAFTISMGKMVEPAIPLLKSGLVQIQSLFQGIPDMMARLKTAMQPVFDFITGPFYTSVKNLWAAFEPAVTPIIKLVGVGLVEAWKLATAGLKWFGDILVAVTGWLKDHQLIVYTVVGAVTAYVTVITALNTIYMTVRLAMLAFAAVQAIVNAVMAANPITLVVVALGALAGAFIYAYTHSETFRNFVNNAWEQIKNAASVAWEVLKTIFEAMKTGLNYLSEGYRLLQAADQAVWNAMVAAGQWAWGIIQTVFAGLKSALDAVIAAWQSFKQWATDAWNAVVTVAQWAAQILLVVVLVPIQIAINVLTAVWRSFSEYWAVAWQGIKDGAAKAWADIKANVFDPLVNFVNENLIPIWNTFRDNVVRSWNEIKDGISSVWEAIKAEVFQPLADFVNNTLMPIWQQFRDNVLRSWEEIKTGAAQLRDDVVNAWNALKDGIQSAYNTIKSAVLDALNEFIHNTLIPAWNTLRDNVIRSWGEIRDGLLSIWNAIKSNVFQPIVDFVHNTLEPLWGTFKNNVLRSWNEIKDGVSGVWEWLKANVWNPMIKFITETIPDGYRRGVQYISDAWQKVKAAMREPLQIAIDIVWNQGIVKVWNDVADITGIEKRLAPYNLPAAASGRVVDTIPGYTPGRDPYTFYSPGANAAIALSGGEAVLRPEVTRALGTSTIEGLNAAARRGGVGGVGRHLGGFAMGGVIKPPIGVPLDDGTVWDPNRVDPLTNAPVGPSPIAKVTKLWDTVNGQVAQLNQVHGGQWGDRMAAFMKGMAGNLWEHVKAKAEEATAKLKATLTAAPPGPGPGEAGMIGPTDSMIQRQQDSAAREAGWWDEARRTSPDPKIQQGLVNAYRKAWERGQANQTAAAARYPNDPAKQKILLDSWHAAANLGLGSAADQLKGEPSGVVQMMNALRVPFPDLPLYSGYRNDGSVGAEHKRGWSVDVPPWMSVFNWIHDSNLPKLHLIFSQAPPSKQYAYGKEGGYISPSVKADHFDHVHWSERDRGGFLPPGWNMTYNGTGKHELVLTAKQFQAVASGQRQGNALVGSVHIAMAPGASAHDVVNELGFALRHSRATARRRHR
jgi:tape measure domain-containing protein